MSAATRSWGFSQAPKGRVPVDTLILDFWSLELWEKTFTLFLSHLVCVNLVKQP